MFVTHVSLLYEWIFATTNTKFFFSLQQMYLKFSGRKLQAENPDLHIYKVLCWLTKILFALLNFFALFSIVKSYASSANLSFAYPTSTDLLPSNFSIIS